MSQDTDVQMLVHWRIAAGGRAFDFLLMELGRVFMGSSLAVRSPCQVWIMITFLQELPPNLPANCAPAKSSKSLIPR